MINADNIGKRIRILRKQKHVSQERMAEDLGMYQADISNLERAIGGSGITDLFKLDLIADYFGVSLGELLNGFHDSANEAPASESKKTEEYEMKDYVIDYVKHGEVYDNYISEIKLLAPDGEEIYVSFQECEDEPRFFKSRKSLFEELMAAAESGMLDKKTKQACFLSGEDYIDIFNKVDPKWVSICRYLIFVATEDEETVTNLIQQSKEKAFEEFDTPIPNREPEDLFYVNYSDLSTVYRYRLMVEAGMSNPSIYDDLDSTIRKQEKAILEKLKAACASEEAYKVWKKDLVDAKVKEVMEKQHIVVCDYMFAGIGSYKEIMPEEMVESFKCWIDGNGSAFYCGSRDATRREIRTYVSHHIADELLGIEPIF